jgi:hypothetical protein
MTVLKQKFTLKSGKLILQNQSEDTEPTWEYLHAKGFFCAANPAGVAIRDDKNNDQEVTVKVLINEKFKTRKEALFIHSFSTREHTLYLRTENDDTPIHIPVDTENVRMQLYKVRKNKYVLTVNY